MIRLFTIQTVSSCAIFLLISTVPVSAQFLPRDSLLRELSVRRANSATHDTNYVKLLFLVARGYRPNTAQMRPYIEEARPIVQSLQNSRITALLYQNIGNILRLERKFDKARDTLQFALDAFTAIGDSTQVAATIGILAVMYQQRDMFSTALQLYLRTLEIAQQYHDLPNIFLSNANLSNIYSTLKQPEKALFFARQAGAMVLQTGNNAFFAEWCRSMTTVYRQLRQYDSALVYARQGVATAWKIHDSLLVVNVLSQQIAVLTEQGNHTEALRHLDSLLRVESSTMEGGTVRPSVCLLAARTLFAAASDSVSETAPRARSVKMHAALDFAERGLHHAQVSKKEAVELYTILGKIYGKLGRMKEGYEAQQKEIELRDSVFGASLYGGIADVQEQYGLRQKDMELTMLREQERYSLQFRLLLGALALCGFALAGFALNRYRLKNQAETRLRQINEEILQQQVLLEEQAQRIQEMNTELQENNMQLQDTNVELDAANTELYSYIEELNRMNAELDARNEILSELNREKNEFLGIVAHDLKNPLAAIRLTSEMLQKFSAKMTEAEKQGRLQNISMVVDRMMSIITNLLSDNALETGVLAVSLTSVNVSYCIETLRNDYLDRAAGKSIVLLSVLPEVPVFVQADAAMLYTVLENLLSNALKFSPPSTTVRLRVQTGELQCRIAVQDEGPGLSDEDKAKLFGRFVRLTARPTAGEHSTGLGLSIVKKMVEAMNGKVWCESELGRGAAFIVELAQTVSLP